MAGHGGGGAVWIYVLVTGIVLCAVGYGLDHGQVGPHWLAAVLLGVGGMSVVFGSCEAMILSVDGLARRARLNDFVAGTLAGLASNVPEIVMLAFVIANSPQIAFVVVALTLHVSALVLGLYCGLLPRDKLGEARLPTAMVKLSTDLFACASGIFLCTGALMVLMHLFGGSGEGRDSLTALDLYVIGGFLLLVEVIAVHQLITTYSGKETDSTRAANKEEEGMDNPISDEEAEEIPTIGKIAGFGLLGVACSLLGGHAVGDFAESLVNTLERNGFSEMVGAILLSVFAAAGAYVMVATAHVKGKYDIALANISGAVNQVPFVVLPVSMILMAIFSQIGVIPRLADGGVLPINMATTSVMIFGFPIMLILYKSAQDDGKVNWLETASMVAVFGLIVFFLAAHG